MLPEGDQDPQTAWEAGFAAGYSERPFFNRNIPRKQRSEYAKGYIRGCLKRSQHLRGSDAHDNDTGSSATRA